MELKPKLFKVTRVIVPEWGETQTEWEKYFLAGSEETVRAVVESRYGRPTYYRYDEAELKYYYSEEEFEVL